MIAYLGHFRLPVGAVPDGQPAMRAFVTASLREAGCRAYSFGADVSEPGLFHVTELWDSREALEAHFASAHMAAWREARERLGFYDRVMTLFEVAESS